MEATESGAHGGTRIEWVVLRGRATVNRTATDRHRSYGRSTTMRKSQLWMLWLSGQVYMCIWRRVISLPSCSSLWATECSRPRNVEATTFVYLNLCVDHLCDAPPGRGRRPEAGWAKTRLIRPPPAPRLSPNQYHQAWPQIRDVIQGTRPRRWKTEKHSLGLQDFHTVGRPVHCRPSIQALLPSQPAPCQPPQRQPSLA